MRRLSPVGRQSPAPRPRQGDIRHKCITETADGNSGFVRATIVDGLCEAPHGTRWRDAGEALLRAMDHFSFADAWGDATDRRDHVFPGTIKRMMAEKVTAHLKKHLPPVQQAAA